MERLLVAISAAKGPILHQRLNQLFFDLAPRGYIERAQVLPQLLTVETRDVVDLCQILQQLPVIVSL